MTNENKQLSILVIVAIFCSAAIMHRVNENNEIGVQKQEQSIEENIKLREGNNSLKEKLVESFVLIKKLSKENNSLKEKLASVSKRLKKLEEADNYKYSDIGLKEAERKLEEAIQERLDARCCRGNCGR